MFTKITCMAMLAAQLVGFYPQSMEVVSLDYENDIVCMETSQGFHYDIYGCEDWQVGDIAACILYDNGTEEITDDEVIMARYSGYRVERGE